MPKARFKQITINVDKVIPNPKNPRIDLHPGMPLYEKLKESIEHYDYVDPIIWNKRTGMIVSGHQRFQVMKDVAEEKGEKFDTVDVMEVDMPENEQDSFMVAVNKITGLWDTEKLEALFRELSEEDLRYTGYEDFEIDALLSDDSTSDTDEEDPLISHTNKDVKFEYIVEIICSDEDEQKDVFEKMKGEGYKCRVSM